MSNYQLYRTNIALGGQMKWDISVSDNMGPLIVDGFNITPVSAAAPYNRYNKVQWINNFEHPLENVKEYFKTMEGSFYSTYAADSFRYRTSDTQEYRDYVRDGSVEMGLKRSCYSVTGHQFEVFCPVWLEAIPKTITFDIKLYAFNGGHNQALADKKLTLNLGKTTSNPGTYHEQFERYMYNYCKDINLDDRLFSFDLSAGRGAMFGVDVSTGIYRPNVDVNNVAESLIRTERLMMDFDHLIISSLANHNCIARQLFNFNLMVDPYDLIPENLVSLVEGTAINIDVRVIVDGKELNLVDFYSNYEYVPITSSDKTTNVFGSKTYKQNADNCLYDHDCIELNGKNRLTQNVIHWAVKGSGDYIFNMYTPFGTYHGNSPTLWESISGNNDNNVWCARTSLHSIDDLRLFVNDVVSAISMGSSLDSASGTSEHTTEIWKKLQTSKWMLPSETEDITTWNRFVRYVIKGSDIDSIRTSPEGSKITSMSCAIVEYEGTADINSATAQALLGSFSNISIDATRQAERVYHKITLRDGGSGIPVVVDCILRDGALYILIYVRKESSVNGKQYDKYCTIRNLIRSIADIEQPSNFLKLLAKVLSSAEEPKVFTIPTLTCGPADGPAGNSEVRHYYTTTSVPVFRYDGDITPMFVSLDSNYKNYSYIKDVKPSYGTYTETGFEPIYSSIGYYPYLSIEFDANNVGSDEYEWFNKSKLYIMKRSVTFELNINHNTDSEGIKKEINKYFKANMADVYNNMHLYNINTDWDYNQGIREYTYIVNLTLK